MDHFDLNIFLFFQILAKMFGILIASHYTLEYYRIVLYDLFVPSPLTYYKYDLENRKESVAGHWLFINVSKMCI